MRRALVLLLLLTWPVRSDAALPSNEQWRLALMSECQGFGCAALQAVDYSTWSLCTVTTLAASGAGSLHACATSGTASWIVFSVSGTIPLASTLFPTTNKVLDGRGADITLSGGGVNIQTDQVVVAYLKFHNTTLTNVMLQATNNADNSWFHHNTFQNAVDEMIYVGSTACTGVTPPTTVTISWNHFLPPTAESNGAATSDCAPAEWCNKAILTSNFCGGTPAVDTANKITIHHNRFQTEVRHPASNWATIHAFNNYYDNGNFGPQPCTQTNMLSENDIWDKAPSSNVPMGGSSVALCGVGSDTSFFAVTGAYLIDGATYIEDQPGSVFNPDTFYTSAPETANETLRLGLIAGAGWQAVSAPATDPVAAYPLNGAATDSSGNANHGSLVGAPSYTTGRVGQGIALNGTTQFVEVPDAPSLDLTGAYTLAAWVQPTVPLTTFAAVVVKNYTYFLYAGSTGACATGAVLGGTSGGTSACDATPLAAGVWTHVAVTYDGTTVRLYRNGTQSATAASTVNPTATTGTLQLGASTVGEYLSGVLDEVYIYARALAPSEVADLAAQGAVEVPLVLRLVR